MPETAALRGMRVVVTRPRAQAGPLADALTALGAQVILLPAIRLEPAADLTPLDRALRRLQAYAWVIFTSANAVRLTLERLAALGLPPAALAARGVAAIGPATAAALQAAGVHPAFVPEEFIAERVAEGLGSVAGLRVLLPRAAGARPALPDLLRAAGALVEEIPLYRAVPHGPDAAACAKLARGVDVVTFTSPSTVEGFVQIVRALGLDPQRLPGDPAFVCIGPITAAAAAQAGLPPARVAQDYSAPGLVEALLQHARAEESHEHETG